MQCNVASHKEHDDITFNAVVEEDERPTLFLTVSNAVVLE